MADIRLFPGANEPNDVRLFPLEDTTQDVYLYPGALEPNDVQLRPLGRNAPAEAAGGGASPVTYEFTGAVALTLTVTADVDFGDVQPTDVGLAFVVASPLAVVRTATGQVALSFGVSSAFEYISGSVEEESPPVVVGGGGTVRTLWGQKPRPLRPPQTYAFTGNAWFAPGWAPRSPWSFTAAPQSGAALRSTGPKSRILTTHAIPGTVAKRRLHSASPMRFTVTPQLDEWVIIDPDDWLGAILNEEELALGGVP